MPDVLKQAYLPFLVSRTLLTLVDSQDVAMLWMDARKDVEDVEKRRSLGEGGGKDEEGECLDCVLGAIFNVVNECFECTLLDVESRRRVVNVVQWLVGDGWV